MTLVMVVGDNRIILPGSELDEHCISGNRPDHIQAVCDSAGNGRRSHVDIVTPEQATFACMRIKRGNRDAGAAQVEASQSLMSQINHATQPLWRRALWHIFQRNMGSDVTDAHVAMCQHHARSADTSQIGKHFGMAGIMVARFVQSLLIEGCCDEAAQARIQRQAHGLFHGPKCKAAAVNG